MASSFDLLKVMMNESISHEVGKHNLTPIEAMVINMHLPFGTKLELETNLKQSRVPKLRRRKVLFDSANRNSRLTKLKYKGKPLQPPHITTFSRCLLAYKKIIDNPSSIPFRSSQNSSIPTLALIESKLLNKQFKTFYEFKKALRQLWLNYYINYEKRLEIIQQVALLSQLSEDIINEVEAMPEEDVFIQLNEEEQADTSKMMQKNTMAPYEQSVYNNDRLSHQSMTNNQPLHMNNTSTQSINKKIIIYKEMSVEDKYKLNLKVNRLDQRQLLGIIPLLSDNNDNSQEEYFEFDIDSLSALQLNKLQKYVNDCLAEGTHTINDHTVSNNYNTNQNQASYQKESSVLQPLPSSLPSVLQPSKYQPSPPIKYSNYLPQTSPQIPKHLAQIEELHNKSSDDSGSFDYH